MNKKWNELDKRERKKIIIFIIILVAIIVIIVPIIFTVIDNIVLKKSITEENKKYMYNYIEETYGNGETFHVVNQEIEYISPKCKKKCGTGITITGYFDSQENCYEVSFAKINDQRIDNVLTINDNNRCKK